ncbi:protein PHTF2-like isoform X2 [Argiope bruennichi]|uniref:protein PHTF2-like isoform X2 n=1 Tax=Argiope bruennichi TaxID=94029 RepID=UPI002493D4B4|nr:protein PHTF2-like isoform X2 [Argiope bruennichi]
MSSLISALNWYHKKIGAYDKELWEKSVDQRILRGVCAIPKRTTRIKTELIDVDLVRGSAFAKAKPQHSWIAATVSGIKRVFLLPFFYSWWKLQTNALVSCTLVILYFLQILAMYLYFSADEKDFADVPVSEIFTPIAMTFILGIVHSQIVATFSTKKTRKHVTRDKRRRPKCKRTKKPVHYDHESKSSPDSASDERHENSVNHLRQTVGKSDKTGIHHDDDPCVQCQPCDCKRLFKMGQQLRFSFDDNTKAVSSNDESGVDESDFVQPPEDCNEADNFEDSKACLLHLDSISLPAENNPKLLTENSFNLCCHKSDNSIIAGFVKNNFTSEKSTECSESSVTNISTYLPSSSNGLSATAAFTNSRCQGSVERDDGNFSSEEDFFVARKSSYPREEWTNSAMEEKNTCDAPKLCSKNHSSKQLHSVSRRYSDGGLTYKKPKAFQTVFLSLQDHRHSVDNVLMDGDNLLGGKVSGANILKDNEQASRSCTSPTRLHNRRNGGRDNMVHAMKLPINIKNFSSSCDSCTETSPNTPSKPLTSDLEWPLITNTDCNSDSTDCSTQCSEGNASELSPSENPFAWEIQEPSKKPSNIGHTGSDKVSCTIWEHNECKKADLTALDISSAIIQKVDSSQHSSEYLYIGVAFATILSLLPLLFRLRNGISTYIIQDVTTDMLTLTVPTSEEVAKITDNLLDIMLGSAWRTKLVTVIVLMERFMLSLAYFFLLSVAEKTFKQRFLYAKHFCYLTSSRRAKRSDLPHFRLNKVRNIKIWLSIRSYMKKLGPQRSVDVIVSIAFILEVCVVSFLCIQLLKETGQFADKLHCWELLFWTLSLGIFLLRFMVIGSKINKKYRNLSVLITEQINLYLHMEQKPHKKEELMLANNVLKLAADLLKELESPFKISGLCANSYLYNITKVVVLSAFSAVLTDVLGFKLKLYKIKIK